jgi:hypothetical protein
VLQHHRQQQQQRCGQVHVVFWQRSERRVWLLLVVLLLWRAVWMSGAYQQRQLQQTWHMLKQHNSACVMLTWQVLHK